MGRGDFGRTARRSRAPWTVLTACLLVTGCSGATPSADALGDGEAAVWTLAPDQDLNPAAIGFAAMVSRVACNSGRTGEVRSPEIRVTDEEVVVSFTVGPRDPGGGNCQGNDQIRYDITLPEPLGRRVLVDGQCRLDEKVRHTSFCTPDEVRYRP